MATDLPEKLTCLGKELTRSDEKLKVVYKPAQGLTPRVTFNFMTAEAVEFGGHPWKAEYLLPFESGRVTEYGQTAEKAISDCEARVAEHMSETLRLFNWLNSNEDE